MFYRGSYPKNTANIDWRPISIELSNVKLPFIEEEILFAVMNRVLTKSPGPDAYIAELKRKKEKKKNLEHSQEDVKRVFEIFF